MGPVMTNDSSEISKLLERLRCGDDKALGELLVRHRDRLRLMVNLRMDGRLRGRIDESDVLQETYAEVTARIRDYLRDPKMPFFLWLRFLTAQKLLQLHRHHLGAKARDAAREFSLYSGPLPQATSAVLAAQLLGRHTPPSQAAVRAEMQLRLQEALNSMDPIDREVLVMRYFEQLSNAEAAQVLGISESGASSRHLRALKRLKEILNSIPEFMQWQNDRKHSGNSSSKTSEVGSSRT